jgi:hypothetical protein
VASQTGPNRTSRYVGSRDQRACGPVTLNREHTLHVVDLAGNPVLGTQTAVREQW